MGRCKPSLSDKNETLRPVKSTSVADNLTRDLTPHEGTKGCSAHGWIVTDTKRLWVRGRDLRFDRNDSTNTSRSSKASSLTVSVNQTRRSVAPGFYAQVHAASRATVVKMVEISFDSRRKRRER